MLFGPILPVELVTSARRRRYFVVRVAYAVVLLIALWSNYGETMGYHGGQASIQSVARFASAFFYTFAILQLLAVLIVGPAMTVGAISQEREQRTIEYLFASTLTNAEIVFDKLAARLLHMGWLVLTGLPILALAMLLGGIVPEQLAVVFIITLSTMLMVGGIALAVSVWARRTRDAVSRVYIILLAVMFVPWFAKLLAWSGLSLYGWIAPLNEELLPLNPLWTLWSIWDLPPVLGPQAMWWELASLLRNQLIVAGACVAWSAWSVRRVHLKAAGASAQPNRFRLRWRLWRPRLGTFPMVWKELAAEAAASQLGLGGQIAAGLLILCVLGLTCWVFVAEAFSSYPRNSFSGFAVTMGTIVSSVALLLVAARSAGAITSEKERDTWTVLISTPLTGREIVFAKILGNLYAARGAWLMLLFIWGLAVLANASFLLATPFLAGTLVILAVFVSALGLLVSFLARTSIRAIGTVLAICLVLGGGYLFCCFPFIFGADSEMVLAPCIPFLLAFPGIFAIEPHVSQNSGIPIAYVLGMCGYLVATMVLLMISESLFDSRSGRIDGGTPPRRTNNPFNRKEPLPGMPASADQPAASSSVTARRQES